MSVTTSAGQHAGLVDAIDRGNACRNEKLWTLLVADVLAHGTERSRALELLFGAKVEQPPGFEIWLEGQPMSPRKGEGNTEIDLAFGSVRRRGTTEIGIEPSFADGWVCFCEAKLLSDCSTTVANDPTRNQLARVIENLLTFQRDGALPGTLRFSLLTPRFFRDEGADSRLYGYKYRDYSQRAEALLTDLQRSQISKRSEAGWSYPELAPRLARFSVNWATYEDVFALDPTLSDLDVAQTANGGVLPDVVAGRMRQAARRLQISK